VEQGEGRGARGEGGGKGEEGSRVPWVQVGIDAPAYSYSNVIGTYIFYITARTY